MYWNSLNTYYFKEGKLAMKLLKKSCIIMIAFMIVILSMTGCGKPSETAKKDKHAGDDYVVRLGYYNCDHMTAACVGEGAGIYEKMGLKVELSGNGKVPQAMAAGKMDAGYIGTRGLMAAQPKGAPIFIAANNHIGGSMYFVLANDVKDPSELIGQPLGIGAKPEKGESWPVYANQLGIPAEGSNYQALSFDSDQAKYMALNAGKIKGFTC